MNHFFEALISEGKNKALPEEFDYFGKLIGSWKIDYVDNSNSRVIKGEWHFSWVLEGMAIQDVIVLPGFEYGTTLRVYKPDVQAWDVTYCYTATPKYNNIKIAANACASAINSPNRTVVLSLSPSNNSNKNLSINSFMAHYCFIYIIQSCY